MDCLYIWFSSQDHNRKSYNITLENNTIKSTNNSLYNTFQKFKDLKDINVFKISCNKPINIPIEELTEKIQEIDNSLKIIINESISNDLKINTYLGFNIQNNNLFLQNVIQNTNINTDIIPKNFTEYKLLLWFIQSMLQLNVFQTINIYTDSSNESVIINLELLNFKKNSANDSTKLLFTLSLENIKSEISIQKFDFIYYDTNLFKENSYYTMVDNTFIYKDNKFDILNFFYYVKDKLKNENKLQYQYNFLLLDSQLPVMYMGIEKIDTNYYIKAIKYNYFSKVNITNLLNFIVKFLELSNSDNKTLFLEFNTIEYFKYSDIFESINFKEIKRDNKNILLSVNLNDINLEIKTKKTSITPDFVEESQLKILKKWCYEHLESLALNVAIFYNYISINRLNQGFLEVDSNIENGILKTKSKITWEQVHYIISEIYCCEKLILESEYIIPKMSEKFYNSISIKIKVSLNKLNNNTNPEIKKESLELLWRYFCNSLSSIYYASIENNEKIPTEANIQKTIDYFDSLVTVKIDTQNNYGFNNEILNNAFQAIIYVSVALVDWLNINTIGTHEIETVSKILIPYNLDQQSYKKLKIENESEKSIFEQIITNAFLEKEIIPSKEGINLIILLMKFFSNNLSDKLNQTNLKIINRFMSFSHLI